MGCDDSPIASGDVPCTRTATRSRFPGHHVQVDVKFLTLKRKKGAPVRRYQYTAIDDATRVRALKIYRRHTQANAIDFINYVVEKFPFRIRTIRTDRGHEFQALFHWHVADLGMEHVYIKPRTPQLNGKVERSHRTDKDEFYQLLTYRGRRGSREESWPCGSASTTTTLPRSSRRSRTPGLTGTCGRRLGHPARLPSGDREKNSKTPFDFRDLSEYVAGP